MEDIRTVHLKILQERLGDIAWELTQVRFSASGAPPRWRPRLNAYRCGTAFIACVELAGVDRAEIDLRVEPLRITLTGRRRTPAPEECTAGGLQQVLALELDDGAFEREILLPQAVEPENVSAEQRNGLLWITLPLRSPD